MAGAYLNLFILLPFPLAFFFSLSLLVSGLISSKTKADISLDKNEEVSFYFGNLVYLSLGSWRRNRGDFEERVQTNLSSCIAWFDNLFHSIAHTLLALNQNKSDLFTLNGFDRHIGICLPEAFLFAHILDDAFLVWLGPFQFDILRVRNIGMHKQLTSFFVHPVLWHLVLFFVDFFEDFVNWFVFLDEIDSSLRPNSTNSITIIAAQQNTEIDELKFINLFN